MNFVGSNLARDGCWTAPAGNTDKDGYRRIKIGGRLYFAHTLAWRICHETWPALIDHINGDRSDNRIANLREATVAQNIANQKRPKRNTSGFKGVSHTKKGAVGRPWAANISHGNRKRWLGSFATKEEAAKAYDAAALELHKEFANLNFP